MSFALAFRLNRKLQLQEVVLVQSTKRLVYVRYNRDTLGILVDSRWSCTDNWLHIIELKSFEAINPPKHSFGNSITIRREKTETQQCCWIEGYKFRTVDFLLYDL